MTTTPTNQRADLTPFGFTPTENLVYFSLLDRGPSSGYALARELSIARANAYQALGGLVSKGAAVLVGEKPQRFRAIRPDTLYAQIVAREAKKLDDLEAGLAEPRSSGVDPLVWLGSERALLELGTRVLVREPSQVTCIAPASVLTGFIPALRKRSADGAPTSVWSIGDPPQLPIPISGILQSVQLERLFGTVVVIVLAGESVLLSRVQARELRGFWATDALVLGAARGAVAALIDPGPT